MDTDQKFVLFLFALIAMVVISLTAGISYSNYLFAVRQKDCISAGYEWSKIPNQSEMECRKNRP